MRSTPAAALVSLLTAMLGIGCGSNARGVRWEQAWSPIHAGHYPRLVKLGSGDLLATFDQKRDGLSTIGIVRSTDGGRTWGRYASVAAHPAHDDVANAFPLVLADGTLLVAFRHHSPQEKIYRLELSASDDGGATWRHRSTIARGSIGLWEPLLLQLPDGTLQVYYASEEDIFPDQRIEMRASRDGGRTWSRPVTVAREPGSRDGMPGVVRFGDGTLLVVFEASDTPPFLFVIRAVRSRDDGRTWSATRELVYQPQHPVRSRWSAAAPSVVRMRGGDLLVSYQTDEDLAYVQASPSADPAHPRYDYLRHARMKYLLSRDGGRTWGEPAALTSADQVPALWNGLCAPEAGIVYALAGFDGKVWCRRGLAGP
jgi:Neuraminidase (sialidase)